MLNMTHKDFIDNIINTRGQWNIPEDVYKEVHHILPRCLEGEPKVLTSKNKKEHHPNLIWLYPEEHFIAHRLLYLDNIENYGLFASYMHLSKKEFLKAQDYELLRNFNHKIPGDIQNKVNEIIKCRYKTRKVVQRKTDKNTDGYKKEQARRRVLKIQGNKGSKNGMFGQGHKVSDGRNGHASIRYYYKDLIFESRKELVAYLQKSGIKITYSAIRRLMNNQSTLRNYNMYKEVFDNLYWRYKESENSIC